VIAVIDYEAGNLRSVELALKRLGAACRITQDIETVLGADRIVFPGVGAAGKAMRDLERLGLARALGQAFERGVPLLGICLGAQVVMEYSEEDRTPCLGLIPGRVKRFPLPLESSEGQRLKTPHMGWNSVQHGVHPVLAGVDPEDEFYFVHSYYPMPASERSVIGTTEYGIRFPSIIGARNLVAVQFHPEKSGEPGLRLLEDFLSWDGRYAQ